MRTAIAERRVFQWWARAWLAAALLGFTSSAYAAERIVSIDGGKAPLYGTLEEPDGDTRLGVAVLLIAGSGPTDRNGNSTVGGAPNTLKLVADALAKGGVASLRTDKRGIGASAAAASTETDLRLSTYVNDTAAWSAWLRAHPGVRCVVLVGHSEGALIALLAAAKTPVCGVVTLEGPGRPLADVLREQVDARMPEPLRDKADSIIDALRQGRSVQVDEPALQALFRPAVQPYLISEFAVDPAAAAKAMRAPLLIVHGDADRQVSLADAQRLQAARPDAMLTIVPGMTHPLKALSGAPGTLGVNDPNLLLAPGLSASLIAFVRASR